MNIVECAQSLRSHLVTAERLHRHLVDTAEQLSRHTALRDGIKRLTMAPLGGHAVLQAALRSWIDDQLQAASPEPGAQDSVSELDARYLHYPVVAAQGAGEPIGIDDFLAAFDMKGLLEEMDRLIGTRAQRTCTDAANQLIAYLDIEANEYYCARPYRKGPHAVFSLPMRHVAGAYIEADVVRLAQIAADLRVAESDGAEDTSLSDALSDLALYLSRHRGAPVDSGTRVTESARLQVCYRKQKINLLIRASDTEMVIAFCVLHGTKPVYQF
jgi:hypothetical protein